jgi:hypothetical protein
MEPNNDSSREATSQETLKLIEAVLDYIRSNLVNIRQTWGQDSVQYKQAAVIMDQHLEQNLKRLQVEKSDIADLMSSMSLDDKKPI